MEGENQVKISIMIYSDDNGKKGEKSGRSKIKDEIKKKMAEIYYNRICYVLFE